VTGRFVVLEGGDGGGKSTQVGAVAGWLRSRGVDVVTTFEPGATALGGEIRRLLLDGGDVPARAEALLMAADRAAHIAEVVEPALMRGQWVVSDRHTPSSLVYQGVVRGLGVDAIAELSRFATGGVAPDLVVVLDLPDAEADRRRAPEADRFEREGSEFHEEVRRAYRDLAAHEGWAVVDASGSRDEVTAAIVAHLGTLLDP
jgi:dTMP kinase